MTRQKASSRRSVAAGHQGIEASRASRSTRATSRPTSLASSPRDRAGFTLVEMVVVVGIIVLLVALTVGVLASLSRGSETRRTEDALRLIDAAYQEWKNIAERDLTYGIDNTPTAGAVYDIAQDTMPGDADDHEATDELIDDIGDNAQARDILANISSSLLKAPTAAHPETTLIDAWGTEIITVLPGRLWVNGDTYAKDIDGTILTEFEQAFGVCVNRRLRFVSAGPDGRFGDLSAATGTPAYDDTRDNVYSYPLEAP